MRVLEENQNYLLWSGFCHIADQVNHWKEYFYYILGVLVCTIMAMACMATSSHVFKYAAIDSELSLLAAAPAASTFRLTISMIWMFINRKEASLLFKDLQKIYNEGKKNFTNYKYITENI